MSNKYYHSMDQLEGIIKWPDHKMDRDEFIRGCAACGGNWAAMFLSGIERFFPELYASLPDDGNFDGILLMSIVAEITEGPEEP